MASDVLTFKAALINGKWIDPEDSNLIDIIDPSNGSVCGRISAAGKDLADKALESANKAFETWSKLDINERSKYILDFKEELLKNKSKIISVLVKETGKVTSNAEYDFQMLTDCLSFHLEEVKRNYGTVFNDDSTLSYTKYSPVGVVVCVLTWNFPLLNLGYKLGPILASGCTCVIKPSEVTPLATSMVLDLLSKTGFPPGVVNLVNGTGLDLLEPLCSSTIPRLLTTIGSTQMGRRMIQYSHSSIKRFSLELGGDAPVLLFADVPDLKAAIADFLGLKFANGGQICVSPNRVYIQKDIYDRVIKECQELVSKYDFGSGNDFAPKEEVLQPLVSKQALNRMLELIKDAEDKGARIISGGKAVEGSGFFIQPTILADVTDEMLCQQEEIFGPILPLRTFSTESEAFRLANQSPYGLSAYVYTGSLKTALKAEQEIMCGNVCINGAHYSIELPHGGLKQSGYGKDISFLSLRDYFDIRRVTIKR